MKKSLGWAVPIVLLGSLGLLVLLTRPDSRWDPERQLEDLRMRASAAMTCPAEELQIANGLVVMRDRETAAFVPNTFLLVSGCNKTQGYEVLRNGTWRLVQDGGG